MSFESLLAAGNENKLNIVVAIGETPVYFSKHQVDSGLVIDADKVGLVDTATINPTAVDLRTIKSSINSTTITIKDDAENQPNSNIFTNFMQQETANSLIEEPISLYLGLVDLAFDFSDYVRLNEYIVKEVTLASSVYKIKAKSLTDNFRRPFFNVRAQLTADINSIIQTITVATEADVFEEANYMRIGDEIIQWTAGNKTFAGNVTVFTNVVRGALGSTAESHSADTVTSQLTELEGNPIDMFLQLALSGSGTSIYDVLHDGLGIPDTKINVSAIEAIKGTFFAADQFRLYLGEIESALDFIESEILLPNNLRIIETQSGLSLAILDQSVPGASLPLLDDNNLEAKDTWKISANKIINRQTVLWDYNEGTGEFEGLSTFNDEISQSQFGIIEGASLEFKGVHSDLSGGNILVDRMGRFLARFSTPQVEIGTKAFLSAFAPNPGEKVQFSSPEVPSPGGTLGLDTELEILSKGINLSTGQVSYKLVFTSYFNLRRGVIAPSPLISSVTSQSVFTVPDATCYAAGHFLRLWDDVNSVYFADAAVEVLSIDASTNTITMVGPFTTTLTTSVRLKLFDYPTSSVGQTSRYAFISPNTGVFPSDSSNGYQILF